MSDSYGETPSIRRRAERDIIANCAGQLAEEQFRGKSSRKFTSKPDFNSIFAVAASVVSKDEVEPYLNWLFVRTKVLIKKPVVWRAIEAISKELLKKEILSGKEAFQIWSDIHEEEEKKIEKDITRIDERY
jgi:hypothetical protein